MKVSQLAQPPLLPSPRMSKRSRIHIMLLLPKFMFISSFFRAFFMPVYIIVRSLAAFCASRLFLDKSDPLHIMERNTVPRGRRRAK